VTANIETLLIALYVFCDDHVVARRASPDRAVTTAFRRRPAVGVGSCVALLVYAAAVTTRSRRPVAPVA
jgi:hypothetical protein